MSRNSPGCFTGAPKISLAVVGGDLDRIRWRRLPGLSPDLRPP